MAELIADLRQRRPAFKEIRGQGMPENVRAYRLAYLCCFCCLPQHCCCFMPVQLKLLFSIFSNQLIQVCPQFGAYVDFAILAPFAEDPDEAAAIRRRLEI